MYFISVDKLYMYTCRLSNADYLRTLISYLLNYNLTFILINFILVKLLPNWFYKLMLVVDKLRSHPTYTNSNCCHVIHRLF